MLKKIDDVMTGKADYNYAIKRSIEGVNEHFDNIFECITNMKAKKKNSEKILEEMVKAISEYAELLPLHEREMEEISVQQSQIKNLDKTVNELSKKAEDLEIVTSSTAFKLGKRITWLPNKFKRLLMKNR